MSKNEAELSWEEIMTDPAKVYGKPENVRDDKRLSREQKIAILKLWAFDAKELQVAEEENMSGETGPTRLHQVLVVLNEVESS